MAIYNLFYVSADPQDRSPGDMAILLQYLQTFFCLQIHRIWDVWGGVWVGTVTAVLVPGLCADLLWHLGLIMIDQVLTCTKKLPFDTAKLRRPGC